MRIGTIIDLLLVDVFGVHALGLLYLFRCLFSTQPLDQELLSVTTSQRYCQIDGRLPSVQQTATSLVSLHSDPRLYADLHHLYTAVERERAPDLPLDFLNAPPPPPPPQTDAFHARNANYWQQIPTDSKSQSESAGRE